MKKIIYLLLVFFTTMLASCDEQLDTKLDNSYGDEITWKLPDYALGVLNNAYANIPQTPNSFGGDFLDVATDNAYCNNKSSVMSKYVMGGISSNNNPFDIWVTAYTQFRNIHLFIEKGLGGTVIFNLPDPARNKKIRDRSLGEAYFLRAWWGMELLQRFGGVADDGEALGYPIVLKNLTDVELANSLTVKRNSYEECVLQIIADCDSAFKYLPLAYVSSTDEELGTKHEGRANGKSALALQSRVALFGASPAYQPSGSFAISTDSIDKKWRRAVKYSEKAIATGALGAYAALTEAAYVGNGVQAITNAEFIFRKWYNNNVIEKANFPPLFFGNARTNPSQNLVDAYHTKTGFPVSDSRSGYDPQNPYLNRDNRFELTFFYNGKVFNTDRALEIFTTDAGVKGRDVTGYDYNNSATGYYLRKFMSPKKDMLFNPSTQGTLNDYHQFPLLRRAEMYLNLAEALNEVAGPKGLIAGSTKSAYDIIKDIRTKNGITSTTYLDEMAVNKDLFRTLIMNERRVELAFENQRFFDLRRQLMPLDENIKGVSISKTTAGLVYSGTNPNEVGKIVETRKMNDPKYYYLPIPYSEIAKNPNLKQNKGW